MISKNLRREIEFLPPYLYIIKYFSNKKILSYKFGGNNEYKLVSGSYEKDYG